MIRKVLSKITNSKEAKSAILYALKKAAAISGSELKFEDSSVDEYASLAVKKIDQLSRKYSSKNGRTQEVIAIHEMISFASSDKISDEHALEIAMNVWRKAIDIDNRKYRVAIHNDTDTKHIHLVWSKRNNQGVIYQQKDDYRIIENLLHEAEIQNNLHIVQNRKSLDSEIATQKPVNKRELALRIKGIKTEKEKFKDSIKISFQKSATTTALLANLYEQGFDIIPNGRNSFSLDKDGVIFKASDLGIQYSKLINKHELKEIHDFSQLMNHYETKERRYKHTLILGTETKTDFLKKSKFETVLSKKFTSHNSSDSVEYFYKNSDNRKAFEYYKDPSKVSFKDLSRDSIKAGLQRLTSDMAAPGPLIITGPDYAKKKLWMEFQMMNLSDKGFTVSGYQPTASDQEELKLRRIEYEKAAEKWKRSKPPSEAIKEPQLAPHEHRTEREAKTAKKGIQSLESFNSLNFEDSIDKLAALKAKNNEEKKRVENDQRNKSHKKIKPS